jgi:hypothetical protein
MDVGSSAVGAFRIRGRSSAGRAPALQAGGRRFEPVRLHCPDARSAWALGRPRDNPPEGGWSGSSVGCRREVRGFGGSPSEARCVMAMDWPLVIRPQRCGYGFCVLCQCESGSGASLGAHAFMRSDRQVGFSGTQLFQFVFPDVLTHGSGIRLILWIGPTRSEALW